MADVRLTEEEAKALYELIDQLSGCNPENVFMWDGSDSTEDPLTRAAVKLYTAVGVKVPDGLVGGS